MRTALPSPSLSRGTPLALAGMGTLAVVVGVWVLRVFDPNVAGSFFPPCLFHEFTGLYCPGCGITRALHALVHFDLQRALAMNPLMVVALPLLALMAVHAWTPWRLLSPRLLSPRVERVLFNGYGWIAVLLVYWVLRNLPWWPFAWLAPG
jgi:hypothetical protein